MSRNDNSNESFVSFGTAFPKQTERDKRAGVSDSGQFVPVWKQDARDEKGRRRFHGAFTGGFSAGYFNTVGSKEGWTPSNFVSTRASRGQKQESRPEDFMDEEDLQELASARKLVATDEFDILGGTERELAQRRQLAEEDAKRGGSLEFLSSSLMNIVSPADNSVGIRLLRSMGWKPGQGIGPRQSYRRRQATDKNEKDSDDDDDDDNLAHLTFAPRDTPIVDFGAKSNTFGLGYDLEKYAPQIAEMRRHQKHEKEGQRAERRAVFGGPSTSRKAGFGLGAYEDDDDPDIYDEDVGMSNYNTSLFNEDEQEVESRRKRQRRHRPPEREPQDTNQERCSDGRLPLRGFIVWNDSRVLGAWYAPPKVPRDFVCELVVAHTAGGGGSQGDSSGSKSSGKQRVHLSFEQRGEILGEKPIEDRSVYEYMSDKARDRLQQALKSQQQPSETGVPSIPKETAKQALRGFMPFGDNRAKQDRYRKFLENHAGLLTEDGRPLEEVPLPSGMSREAVNKELEEFSQAARIFKPVSSLMSGRFTVASVSTGTVEQTAFEGGLRTAAQWKKEKEDQEKQLQPVATVAKPVSQEAQAAAMKMYGDLTRTIKPFYPNKLLCKRFNVKWHEPPADAPSS